MCFEPLLITFKMFFNDLIKSIVYLEIVFIVNPIMASNTQPPNITTNKTPLPTLIFIRVLYSFFP